MIALSSPTPYVVISAARPRLRAYAEISGTAEVLTADRAGDQIDAAVLTARQRRKPAYLSVPQDLALFEELKTETNIEIFGALYGLPRDVLKQRAADVLARVGLSDRAQDRPATFSGGMKRRLHIACALVHDPEVLLLDEPTAGVDPQSRNAIFETLESLKAAGKALVYTTHYMEEVERLADRVVIIDHGRVIVEGTLPELVRRLPAAQKLDLDLEGHPDAAALQALPGVRSVQERAGRWTVGLDDLTTGTPGVLQALARMGCSVRHIASGRANLEDVFLTLTGHALRD